jgi:hypothetical protein
MIQKIRTLLHECCSIRDIIIQRQATELHVDEIQEIRSKTTVLQDLYNVLMVRRAYLEDHSDFFFDIYDRNTATRTNNFPRKAL